MNTRVFIQRLSLMLSMIIVPAAWSATTPEKAAQLKSVLTPFGAERAGNKDGSIPAWNGGYTSGIAGSVPGKRRRIHLRTMKCYSPSQRKIWRNTPIS
jgi:hypothetical protein